LRKKMMREAEVGVMERIIPDQANSQAKKGRCRRSQEEPGSAGRRKELCKPLEGLDAKTIG